MAEAEELSKNLALSKIVETNFSAATQKLDKQSQMLAKRILETESKLETTEDEAEINRFDRDSSVDRQALLKNLIMEGKLSEVLGRNAARQKKIHEVEEMEGYDLAFSAPSKKTIEETTKNEEYEPTIQNLGLTQDSVKFLNFNGSLFSLLGGKLIMTDADNLRLLAGLSSDELEKLIVKYPEVLADISGEMLLETTFRINLLKAIASIVFNELKNSDVNAANKKLGEPLSLKRKMISSYESYMSGIRNLFKVKIRKYLLENKPNHAQEIKELPCNVSSPLLPDELYEPDENKAEEGEKTKSIEDEIDEFLKSLTEDNI